MMLLFLSKTNHLRTLLQRTFLSLYIPFHDLHELHVWSGRMVSLDVCLHAIAHTVRWAIQGNLSMLYSHITGITGVISIGVTPLIVLPMVVPALKVRIPWEVRKYLHVFCSIIWGASISFHAPHMWIK